MIQQWKRWAPLLQWKRRAGALFGACAVLSAAACGDGPTAVEHPAAERSSMERSTAGATERGTVAVVCAISYATHGGPYAYQYGRITLKLPAASRAANGSTRQYRFRNHAGTQVVGAAHCTIPATELAVAHLDRFFGVRERGGVKTASDDGARLMTDGVYTIPRITASACQYGGEYPWCDPAPIEWDTSGPPKENQVCYTDCGDGGPTTGGNEPEPPADPEPEPCDKDPLLVADAVQQGNKQIWQNSNYSPTTPQTDRKEQGMFVIRGADGSLSYQPFPESWTAGPCSIAVPPNATAPTGAIAFVHTHPFTTGELMTICGPIIPGTQIFERYSNQASFSDHQVAGILKLTGYMIDPQGVSKFGEKISDGETRFQRCGY